MFTRDTHSIKTHVYGPRGPFYTLNFQGVVTSNHYTHIHIRIYTQQDFYFPLKSDVFSKCSFYFLITQSYLKFPHVPMCLQVFVLQAQVL